MQNNDYIIAVDENGTPFIAHVHDMSSGGGGSFTRGQSRRRGWNTWRNKATKYVDKVRTASGNWRYIYPEDLKKKADNARRRATNAVKEKIGINARTSRNIARENYKNQARNGQGSKTRAMKEAFEKTQAVYDRTLLGRAENLSRSVRNSKANRTLRKYKNQTLASIKQMKSKAQDKKRRKNSRKLNPGNYRNRKDNDRI